MIISDRIRTWLAGAPQHMFAAYAIFFAFFTYFCMYAFRKPFSVAEFTDQAGIFLPFLGKTLAYKNVLIISQVFGYCLSKFYGIKFISEVSGRGRAVALIAFILIAEGALLLFAITPAPYNILVLFINGLPLGMVWGLVFSFLEGRRISEVLGAGLSASYIVASGAVKTVGQILLNNGVPEFWMPVLVGAIFFPVLLTCVYFLKQLPPPSAEDVALRTERRPMGRHERARFVKLFFPGLFFLTGLYMFLTAFRDFRDNFSKEIYKANGVEAAAVFTYPEIVISIVVLIALAFIMKIRNNEKALILIIVLMAAGSLLVGLSTIAYQAGLLNPVVWMTLIGTGLYIAYVPYGCILFDRMIAAIGFVGTAGFMIYVTDAFGYLGTVVVLLYKDLGGGDISILDFFISFSYTTAAICFLSFLAAGFYFHFKMIRGRETKPVPAV